MKKIIFFLLSFVLSMVFTLIFLDIQQLIVTPLTPFGINHWIPEFLTLICLGYLVVGKFDYYISIVIAGCILLYPALTYLLMTVSIQFSLGTGTFFTSAFIMGMWMGSKKERKK